MPNNGCRIMTTVEIATLSKVATARRRASAQSAKRSEETEAAIRAARAVSVSWAEISERLEISEGQAKWLMQRHLTPESLARQEGDLPRTAPRPGRGPGVGVTEAARMLGVTRRTVYLWCSHGRLNAVRNDQGKLRVLLEQVSVAVTAGADAESLTNFQALLDTIAVGGPNARLGEGLIPTDGLPYASVVVATPREPGAHPAAERIALALMAAGIAVSVPIGHNGAAAQLIAHLA
jgi:excisionase family DNA binding protein